MGAYDFFQFSECVAGVNEIFLRGGFRQCICRTTQADDQLMDDLVLRLQLRHNLAKPAATRCLDPGEHVGAFNVVVKLEHLAFTATKRSERSKILSHIE